MAMNLRCRLSVFVGLLIFSATARALDNYKEYNRDRWDIEVGTQFFYSEANYLSMGESSQSLASGNHYQLLDSHLATRYTPKKNWAIFAAGNMANAESKNSISTRTNSSLTEVSAGVDFVMYSELFQLIPEFAAVMPLTKVDQASDEVLNSEGVIEVRSRLIAQKDFSLWRGYGWLGFNYRGDGRSFLMPWGVGLQWKLGALSLGAEVFGYQSVSEDSNKKDSLVRSSYINSVNGGSMKFYSVEPSLVDSQLLAIWKISPKWTVQAYGGTTLAGANTAAGYHVGGLLRYTFDLTEGYVETPVEIIDSPVPSYRSNMHQNDSLSTDKRLQRFREETDDGVDQNLFKAQPTKKPRLNQDKLKKQMDDVEFQIEMKSNKKKKRR